MSRAKGEGRSPAEKGQRLIAPGYNRERRKAEAAEEADWAARSGPVTVRKEDQ